jgi:hypothetical protein
MVLMVLTVPDIAIIDGPATAGPMARQRSVRRKALYLACQRSQQARWGREYLRSEPASLDVAG